ncbi:right-handed parallel beta-helix repeat-containing protein [Candidatus Saganbacteria bacterium]|nr:right-handed parallel beta-helix repeat-containing protein [Candidatus Saganbacteria bacterium]
MSGAGHAVDYYVTNTSSESTTAGSLAYAVAQIASPGPHNIYFNIPAGDAGYLVATLEGTTAHFWRIKLNNANLIDLRYERVFINGSSQTSFAGDVNPFGPEIEISGEDATSGNLITISAANRCTIEGLAIIKGPGSGAVINSGNLSEVLGCYIGLFATGEAAAANLGYGVYINSGNDNLVGGTPSALRNVISGNSNHGIYLLTSSTTTIKGNYIGTNRNGTLAVANAGSGIYIDNYPTNTVDSNYISGNTGNGIVINGSLSSGNTVLGNYIGLGTTEANLGNSGDGILIQGGANSNTIGTNNRIAYNGSDGVEVNGAATTKNHLTQNSTYLNTAEGINLVSGGNSGLSVPTIATAEYYSYSNQTYINGTGAAGRTIEIFRSDGAGEGRAYLGNTLANTSGEWAAYVSNLATGEGATASSTDANGNTSEFAVQVTTVNSGATEYRPDGMVGNQSNGSDYIGEGVFNLSGTNQTKTQALSVGQTATYYFKIKNAGNTAEYISVLGTGDSTGWTVIYYDATSGGNDITSQVTGGSGWPTLVNSSEAKEIRATVHSTADTPSTKEVFVTSVSSNNTTKKDVVGATTTASNPSNVGSFSVSAPSTGEADVAFEATITARNAAGAVTTEVKTVYLSIDAGTIAPTSLAASYFIDDGIWTGSVTLDHAGTRTLTVTTEGSSATGTATIVVSCATTEYTNSSLGVTISVPAGAANEQLSISAAEGTTLPGAAPSGYRQAGKIIVITSNVTNFLLPVTVTMPLYQQAPDPQAYYWDGINWSQSGITRVSYTTSSITFTTTHLSTFVPFSQVAGGAISFGPSPYNPSSGSQAAFWYWLDADKTTSLYIFDAAGNQIFRETYLPGSNGGRAGVNVISWNGRNSWNEVLDNGVYPYRLVQEGKAIAKGKLIIFRR